MRGTIRSLTSLRFFAAAIVVIEHTRGAFDCLHWIGEGFPFWSAVSFFFVLSGFILSYAHDNFEKNGQLSDFYVARFARIWPIHIATLLIYLAILPASFVLHDRIGSHPIFELALNLALLQSWIPKGVYFMSFNVVAWSLSAEAFFYLVFPFLRKDLERTWHVKLVGTFLVALAIVVATTLLHVKSFWKAPNDVVTDAGLIYAFPPVRLLEFVAGIVTFRVFSWVRFSFTWNKNYWTVIEFLSLWLIPASYFLGQIVIDSHFVKSLWGLSVATFTRDIEAVPAFALLILIFAMQKGALSRMLCARPLVFLGEISFSLYMVHHPIFWFVYLHQNDILAGIPNTYQFFGYIAAVLLASVLLHNLVEIPVRQWIRSFYERIRDDVEKSVAT